MGPFSLAFSFPTIPRLARPQFSPHRTALRLKSALSAPLLKLSRLDDWDYILLLRPSHSFAPNSFNFIYASFFTSVPNPFLYCDLLSMDYSPLLR